MNPISRRRFVNRLSLSAAGAIAYSKLAYSSGRLLINSSGVDEYIKAETTHGKIRGIRSDNVNIFKGIPYAGKVSGERRFRRPAPLDPWTGIRDALQLGAPAIQELRGAAGQTPSEDCLFLNVWTPANDNKKRPVMFYNHGGGFVVGSGGAPGQDGANLARNFGVVVVETNHRLGLLGFLYLDEIAGEEYTGSGNMGILDITAGLKWVYDNIAEFGGDPNNVMIFGESGGGGKTSCLYALPEAAPYFNKASIESGPGIRMLTKPSAAATTDAVLKELNISRKNWRKLLDVPASDLLSVQNNLPSAPFNPQDNESVRPGGFRPVVDGIVLPYHPFDPTAPEISRNKPLMTGWNEDEYTFFAWERQEVDSFSMDFNELAAKLEPQFGKNTQKIIDTYRNTMPDASAPDIYIAVSSIAMMGLGSVEIAEKKAKQNGAPVYLYNFGYKSDMKIPGTDYEMGTPHAMDITFKFNNEVPPKDGEPEGLRFGGSKPDRFVASHNMAELWTTFARTGKPAAEGIPEWPAYSLQDRATMRIDVSCEVIYDRFKKELDMWRSIGQL